MFLYSGKLAHLMNVEIYKTTLFCRSKCIYQFAIASSAVRQRRNYILLPCGFIYFSIFSFFFWDLLVSMDSQVPRPALNNLAPSTPELLAFWVGNLLSAKFQEF